MTTPISDDEAFKSTINMKIKFLSLISDGDFEDYRSIWDAACSFKKAQLSERIGKLIESIETAREALEWYAIEGKGTYSEARMFRSAREALSRIDELLGGKE